MRLTGAETGSGRHFAKRGRGHNLTDARPGDLIGEEVGENVAEHVEGVDSTLVFKRRYHDSAGIERNRRKRRAQSESEDSPAWVPPPDLTPTSRYLVLPGL